MSILVECYVCHRKQAAKNKRCIDCETNLDKRKKSGAAKFWIITTWQKKQRWESMRGTLKQAVAAEGKRSAEKEEGIVPILNIKSQQLTVSELVAWYLGLDIDDRENKTRNLKEFVELFGTRPVISIVNSDLEGYQKHLKKKGLADSTVDGHLRSVQTAINEAAKDKKIPREVKETFKIKRLLKKGANIREAIYTPEQFIAIRDVIRERSKLVWSMLGWGSFREGEIVNLMLDRIDLKEKLIKLRPEDTKEGKEKLIPIIEDFEAIEKRIEEAKARGDDQLFTLKKDRFIDDVHQAHKKLGLPYGRGKHTLTAHSLRHTFATSAMRAGIPQAMAMRIMGHSTQEMNLRYSHPQLDDVRADMEKVKEFIKNGGQERPDELKMILEKLGSLEKRIGVITPSALEKETHLSKEPLA